MVHKNARSSDSESDLNILRLRALVSKFAWQINSDPENISLRNKLVDVNRKLEKAVKEAALQKFNDDMRKQEAAEQKNDTSFWEITGTLLNKSAYQTSIDKNLSQNEIVEKLDFYDKTFIRLDPSPTVGSSDFENIVPEKTIRTQYRHWLRCKIMTTPSENRPQ